MFLLLYILFDFSLITVLYLCIACGLLNVTLRYSCTSIVGNLFRKDKPPNFVALTENGEGESKSRLIWNMTGIQVISQACGIIRTKLGQI
jgi:hypothetical protein